MKLFTGWCALLLGMSMAVSAATAQVSAPQETGSPPHRAVSDFNGPYGALPPEVAEPGYGPEPAYGPPLLPPREVFAVLRENGFLPLGPPRQRGLFYIIAVTDRYGDDGRLVIDARNGLIVRFVPTYRMGTNLYGAAPIPYPPGGRLPPVGDIRDVPRPPAPVPTTASHWPVVPLPKPAPPRPLDDKPIAEKPVPQPSQRSAAVQVKPADMSRALHAAPSPTAEVKPAAPQIQPTQPMPKALGLD